MAQPREVFTSDKIFIFINIAFAMYSGALLATAARLAWDPSTYTWFRFLCRTQYYVSTAYVLAAGLWLAALASLAVVSAGQRARRYMYLHAAGVASLAASEVVYGAWMFVSMSAWWREAPQARLVRRGMDVVHDLKPALLSVEIYRDVAVPIYDMIEEVERAASSNAIVIIVFGLVGGLLQVAAFVMALRLGRRAATAKEALAARADDDPDDDSELAPPGWRKRANLGMYTIIDKIF